MQKTYQSAGEITRRIGGTNYRVRIHYQADADEDMQEKVLRLIQNDLHFSEENKEISFPKGEDYGTMNLPQVSRPA
ncbi:MAG: transposon-encoded TnpW family protein [Clostridia bacterium]|nr:transposon-encoded TnpW family protein [Clostridia bacterium]